MAQKVSAVSVAELTAYLVTHLCSKAGGSGWVGEQPSLGVVGAHVPRRACCGIKVVVPVFVKGVIGVGHSVDQPIVKHLGGSCNATTCTSVLLAGFGT